MPKGTFAQSSVFVRSAAGFLDVFLYQASYSLIKEVATRISEGTLTFASSNYSIAYLIGCIHMKKGVEKKKDRG